MTDKELLKQLKKLHLLTKSDLRQVLREEMKRLDASLERIAKKMDHLEIVEKEIGDRTIEAMHIILMKQKILERRIQAIEDQLQAPFAN